MFPLEFDFARYVESLIVVNIDSTKKGFPFHLGTRPRGQRCVLGLKRDIDQERVIYFDGQTDRRIYPVIEMREHKSNISNEFRHIICAVNVSFLHFSQERYGPTDGPTDGRTLLWRCEDASKNMSLGS